MKQLYSLVHMYK